MISVRTWGWIFTVIVFALSGSAGWAEDSAAGRRLIRTSFSRLVPTSYPIVHPRFNRLRPTTYPVIHPGVPQLGITNNLTSSFARPLLLTSPVTRSFAPPKTREAAQQALARKRQELPTP